MIIKSVIIDDDLFAIDELKSHLKNFPSVKIIGTFSKPLEALAYLKGLDELDLVFMDVDMPLLNGVELSSLIRAKIKKLVFTTSHARYALDAFKVDAHDFLLKPFSLADLIKTMDKVYPEREVSELFSSQNEKFFYVKNKEDNLKLVKVEFDSIIAIESLLNYIRIHTDSSKIVTHMTLKDAKDALQGREEFIQFHRSFIISLRHIAVIQGNILTMSSGVKFTIGESYREVLNSFLSDKILKSAIRK